MKKKYVILKGKPYLFKEGINCNGCYFKSVTQHCSNTIILDYKGEAYNCRNDNLILVEDTSETYINF